MGKDTPMGMEMKLSDKLSMIAPRKRLQQHFRRGAESLTPTPTALYAHTKSIMSLLHRSKFRLNNETRLECTLSSLKWTQHNATWSKYSTKRGSIYIIIEKHATVVIVRQLPLSSPLIALFSPSFHICIQLCGLRILASFAVRRCEVRTFPHPIPALIQL